MADDQDRAGIVAEQLLQQVERLEIEIVGRLVEHHQVRRLRQRARQHQPAALAARQLADRRARLLRREQEVLHVADDVLALAVDQHIVQPPPVSASDSVVVGSSDARRWSSLAIATLVPSRTDAGVGRERAGQQLDQRRLARAVGADDADPVAAHHPGREILDHRPAAVALADLLRLDHQRARDSARPARPWSRRPRPGAPRAARAASSPARRPGACCACAAP